MLSLSHWCLKVVLVLLMWRQTVAEENDIILDDDHSVYLAPGGGQDKSPVQIAAIMDKLTSLDKNIAELKDQVAQLVHLSSGAGIQQVLLDLQGVCEELSASRIRPTAAPEEAADTTTESPIGQSHKCPPRQPSNQLQVTAAMKEETETAYIVTVCYVSPEKPRVTMQLEINSQPEPVEHEEFGVVTVERKKPENGESAHLSLGFVLKSEYYVHLSLRLDEHSSEEVHIPDIQMTVDPGNTIIYNPGSDVDIKFNIINEVRENVTEYSMEQTSLGLKSNSEQNLVDRYRLMPGLELPEELSGIQYTETNYSAGNKTLQLHIPYSPEREGGVVIFKMMNVMKCYENCLVHLHLAGQSIVFHPRGWSGPFPDNFVGFVETKFPRDFEEDSDVVTCYEEGRIKNCLLGCVAIGDDPSVTLSRADPAPVSPHTKAIYNESKFFASAYQEIKNPVKGDEGVYLCQAKSRDGSHVITRPMTLIVHRVAKIIRPMTNVTTSPNGSLSAECTAEGDPLPKVYFAPFYDSDPTSVIDNANVTVTQLNETTSQATLLLADWKSYDRNDLDNIYCKAKNVEYSEDIDHLMVDLDEYK